MANFYEHDLFTLRLWLPSSREYLSLSQDCIHSDLQRAHPEPVGVEHHAISHLFVGSKPSELIAREILGPKSSIKNHNLLWFTIVLQNRVSDLISVQYDANGSLKLRRNAIADLRSIRTRL